MDGLKRIVISHVDAGLRMSSMSKGDVTKVHYYTQYTTDFLDILWSLYMAGKAKNNTYGNNFPKIDFVSHKLTQAQKDAFNAWLSAKNFDSDLEINDLCSRGWKLSISFDFSNDVYIGSATCKKQGDPNENICVSSRYDNASTALLATVFKIAKIWQHGTIPREEDSKDFG